MERRPSSILFFLPDLNGGGAQRTVLNLVHHLDRERFHPILVLGRADGVYRDLIRDDMDVVDLGKARVRGAIVALSKQISLRRPSILFSAYPDGNMATMLARFLTPSWRGCMVFRESNHRSASEIHWSRMKKALVGLSYRKADRVVALSNGVLSDLRHLYGLPAEKVVTIYNPVDTDSIRSMAGHHLPSSGDGGLTRILSVGRLVRQKGFDLLIRAVALLKDERIQLTILGDGPEEASLRALAEELGVSDRVKFPGFTLNPFKTMRNSDLFVLSSRWEGFGHVIVEAMVVGLAVVATCCPSGPDEIITDGVDGLLCPTGSPEALADKIVYLIRSPQERRRMAIAAQSSSSRFDVKKIAREYEMLFEGVLAAHA